MFLRSPKATELACKLRLAAEAQPDDKKLQDNIKNQIHEVIDGGEFDDADREPLHSQVDEMCEGKYSTTTDILSRFSGKLKGFKYEPDKKLMNVNMQYSSEGQMVDQLFGDEVACKQFNKFAEGLGGAPVKGKRGNTVFKNKDGQPVFQLNIDGFDEEDDPQTAAMRDFKDKTARTELRRASMMIYPPPPASEKDMGKAQRFLEGAAKKKFSKKEWEKVSEAFESGKSDPEKLAKSLGMWPLLKSEEKFLKSKTASERIAMRLMIGALADRIVDGLIMNGSSGQQTRRKDKDLMTDTGGISKNRQSEPEFRPSRSDSQNRYRTKDKPSEQRDKDVDAPDKDKKASETHPLDRETSGGCGITMPENNYHRQVWSRLTQIISDIQHISEKDFAKNDEIHSIVDGLIRSPKGEEMICAFQGVGARPEMCAEGLYFEMIVKGKTASGNVESKARSQLASTPKTFREAVQRG